MIVGKISKCKVDKDNTHLIDNPVALALDFLALQKVRNTVLHSARFWKEDEDLVADPGELIVPQVLLGKVVVEGSAMGPGHVVHPDDDVGEVGVEGSR